MLVFFFLLPVRFAYSEVPGVWQLSLKDVLKTALCENTIITIHKIGEDASKQKVIFENGIFVPDISMSAYNTSNHWNQFSLQNYRDKNYYQYLFSARTKNEDGSELSLNFSSQKNCYTYMFPQYDLGEYNSSVYLKYYIPLLRGYGNQVNLVNVDKAKIELANTIQRYESMRADVLFNVYRSYFDLFKIREELKVSRGIKRNSEEIFKIVKEKVEMRRMPITEQLKIEVSLEIQDQTIVSLENDEKKKIDQLMISIYNDPTRQGNRKLKLLTSPETVFTEISLPPVEEMAKRIDNVDMELINLDTEYKLYQKDYIRALSDIKPNLNVSTELGLDGYDWNSAGSSIQNISSNNYRVNLGLEYRFPVNNSQYASKLREIKDRMDQAKIKMDNRKNEIVRIARDLTNDMNSLKERMRIYEKAISIAKENLNNETERLIRGKSTVLYTLNYQSDLSNSMLQLVRLRIECILLFGTYKLYSREMEALANVL